jgi:tetratricopeptide (TPR) repeat protein
LRFGFLAALTVLALAMASRLSAEQPVPDVARLRELSVSYGNLAEEHLRAGDVAAARAWLEKAVQIDNELLHATPDSELAQRDLSVSIEQLGDVLRQQNDFAGARKQYERSRDLRQKLVERQSKPDRQSLRDLSISLERLGVVHRQTGDWDSAAGSLQAALRLRQQIAEAAPASTAAKRELSVTLVLLGDVQMARGRLDEACSSFERARRLDQELWEANRTELTATRDLSISHERLGDLHLRLAEKTNERDQAVKAREHFEQSVKLREAVAELSGNSVAARQDLALAFNRVGEACLKLGKTATARQSFERALAVRQSLATGSEVSRSAKRDLLRAYEKIGRLSLQLGFADRARENFEQARQLAERLRKESDDADSQADWAGVAGYRGAVEMQAEDFVSAGHWFEQGIAVLERLTSDDSSPSALRWRGWLERQREQLAQSQQAERALRELDFIVTIAESDRRRAAELLRIRARDQARRMVPADSAEALRQAIDLADAKHRVSFARWLSLAAAAVGEPTEKMNPPDVIERRKYVSLAIDILREVRSSPDGPATLQRLATEADFTPLRSEPRFQELLKAIP